MKPRAFRYLRVAVLDDVFEQLEQYGEEARILAGGQSLMPMLNMRLAAPEVLLDINGLAGLAGITLVDDHLEIGALTRHREVEASDLVGRHAPLLSQAMPHIAHVAVRNRGTFGGSIALADPAAELPACCLALQTRFVLASRAGRREVAAAEFFQGLYETALEPGELLVAARIPVLAPGYRSCLFELARRHGDYAIVGLGAHACVQDGSLACPRLVFFGIGDRPTLAAAAAAVLDGQMPESGVMRQAQQALAGDLAPFSDPQASAATRLHLARVLLGRAVAQLVAG